MKESIEDLTSRTIADFGDQWTSYRKNPGYYGTVLLLEDFFGPLLTLDAVRGKRIGDIGSGTGRIVNMLLDAGADHVVAVEPSAAFEILRENTSSRGDRISYVRDRGEALPCDANLDLVVSMGVLHHIPRPEPAVEAAWGALRPGGYILVWLYGKEGNEIYLRLVGPLRAIAAHLPHRLLVGVCRGLNAVLDIYLFLCRYLPIPMRKYMRDVLGRLPRKVRELTIYDQLNPAFAKYYTKDEAEALLTHAGFNDVRAWHRHGYSWSVVGRRPDAGDPTASARRRSRSVAIDGNL